MSSASTHALDFALLAQYAVIAVLVLGAAAYVLHDRAPALSRKLRVAIAIPLVREGKPSWMRTLGRRIAPPVVKGGSCGSCSGCAPD